MSHFISLALGRLGLADLQTSCRYILNWDPHHSSILPCIAESWAARSTYSGAISKVIEGPHPESDLQPPLYILFQKSLFFVKMLIWDRFWIHIISHNDHHLSWDCTSARQKFRIECSKGPRRDKHHLHPITTRKVCFSLIKMPNDNCLQIINTLPESTPKSCSKEDDQWLTRGLQWINSRISTRESFPRVQGTWARPTFADWCEDSNFHSFERRGWLAEHIC